MLVLFFLLLLLPPTWLSVHVLRLHSWPRLARYAAVGLLFLISQTFTINHFVFGSLAGPQMPRNLLIGQSFALLLEIFLFLWFLARDVLRYSASKSGFDSGRRRFLASAPLAGFCFSCGFSGTGVANGLAVPIVREYECPLERLPKALEGFRLCFLSDLHVGPQTTVDWVLSCVARIQACQPDCIVFGGDLSDGLPSYRDSEGLLRSEVFRHFKGLSAPSGLWACTGNHEYYSDYAAWMRLYEEIGIRFLHTERHILRVRGESLVLIGRDDRQGDRYFGRPAKTLESLEPLPPRERAVRILFDHRPERAQENASIADLQLSGHTHGGQCYGMDRLVARANHGYVRGWYTVDGMSLYVSNGAGLWSGFPVRIGVPAEIASITLVPGR
ncbi:MAG: metallophosphoesterase family protein [Desulfovibrionaceae bacterium]|nr:metallophosphoesterase family protein [Desulfovibrionaceae bacterium]